MVLYQLQVFLYTERRFVSCTG